MCMLQCAAVCCSLLQCRLQCATVCCSVWAYVCSRDVSQSAEHGILLITSPAATLQLTLQLTLQHKLQNTATHTRQYTTEHQDPLIAAPTNARLFVWNLALQHTATHCNTLQHILQNTLQHTMHYTLQHAATRTTAHCTIGRPPDRSSHNDTTAHCNSDMKQCNTLQHSAQRTLQNTGTC